MPETRFLTDLGLLFLAALGGGLLAQAVHQPLIVGYILAGVLIGPFTPGPTLSDPHAFQLFADVGVVLLMFTIGVEFRWKSCCGSARLRCWARRRGLPWSPS